MLLMLQSEGHDTRGNFSCDLSRNDDDWKTLQVAEGVSHVRNIFSQLATPPEEIVYDSFSASLKSLASKRRDLIAQFSQNCLAGFDGHVTHRIFLLFLHLATQHFVALQVAKLGCYTWNLSCNLSHNNKLQEKLPRVTWPLLGDLRCSI